MARWFSRRARTEAGAGPRLSIVVPAYRVEKFLDACLDSLRHQSLAEVEILVVDDGSPDKVAALTRRQAKADPRVRLISQANAGVSAARTTGIAHARGTHLTFVDPDDLVTVDGLRAAVESLEASGSDWAVLPYRQFSRAGERAPAPWIAELFAAGTRTVRPAENPALLVHAIAAAKVYRREFWDAAGLAFRPGAIYEDQEVAARAWARATAIDVVDVDAYRWRLRAGSTTRESSGSTMSRFFTSVQHALTELEPVPGAAAERARQLLSIDVPRYLRALPDVEDPAYAGALFAGIESLWSSVAEPGPRREAWRREAPAEAKVTETLVASGRGDDVAAFVAADGFTLASHRFVLLPEGPAVALPFFDDASLPREVFVLGERQTPADARVLRVVLDERGGEVEFLAHLRHLDAGRPGVRAWLGPADADADDAAVVALDLTPVEPEGDSPGVARGSTLIGHRIRTTRRSNEHSVWHARWDWADLPAGTDTSNAGVEWALHVEVSDLGRTASTRVDLIDPSGSAGWPQTAGGWHWTGVAPGRFVAGPAGAGEPRPGLSGLPDLPDLLASLAGHPTTTVRDTCPDDLARLLPVDASGGWLGLGPDQSLVWTALPDVPREQLTVWWRRDGDART